MLDSSHSVTREMFGLLGGFAGDDNKFQAASTLMERLAGSDAHVSIQNVVVVMEQLPLKGRMTVAVQGIANSPARDGLVRSIFDWCFAEHDDDNHDDPDGFENLETEDQELDEDFVVVRDLSKGNLNPMRYHIASIFAMAVGSLGESRCRLLSQIPFVQFDLHENVHSNGHD